VLTYVAEITEPKYRGILSALGTTCVITGVFIQFILGSLMDWRSVAAVSSAFPVITILMLCFVPESPVWLIREQRFREAVKSLQWLRGWVPEHMIEAEFNQLYDELITQKAIELSADGIPLQGQRRTLGQRLRMWRKRSFLVPFLLVSFSFFTGHFSGKTPLQTYAVQIFHTLKAPMNKYHATILLGVAEMLATILGVVLIHFTGKRPLVLVSTVGTGLCFFGTATYAHFLSEVPGFTVNNVVVNASSIMPKEGILSQDNISRIFETEQQAIRQETERFTTLLPDMETTTMFEPEAFNRSKRDVDEMMTTDAPIDTTIWPEPSSSAEPVSTSSLAPPSTSAKPPIVEDLLLVVPKQENNYLVWVPLILLLLSAFFSHLGIRMLPWILIGEVFPAEIRNTASGFAGGVGYIFGFLANKLFLVMLSALTLPGTFAFYASVAFVGTIVLYFTLPETEGRTLGVSEHKIKHPNRALPSSFCLFSLSGNRSPLLQKIRHEFVSQAAQQQIARQG